MKKEKQVIEGPEIKITGKLGRFEIVKSVVSSFIEFEKDKKGKGIEFRYPVEKLSNGETLYIHRPGVKWNFDFKVEIPQDCGLEDGRHDQIALILRDMKRSSKEEFDKLQGIIDKLYHCLNNDVDDMLKETPISYKDEVAIDILLKVIKWLFIMEDIIYWHYEGRAFLYNFFVYAIHEEDEIRFQDTISKIRQRKIRPDNIKRLLKERNIEWKLP
ncbi:MAG TPA: hypothetical protein EYP80_02830 [Candidatus Aenigmarchaeota archaeon]|nr:hypothetical protein [Candidatus Aenigmarchaeota archaeon]